MISDECLAMQIQQGKEYAFEAIVRRYHGPIHGYIVRMGGEYHVANDIVQEVFIKIFRNIHQYRSSLPFRPWIFAIASNAYKDYLKKTYVSRDVGGLENMDGMVVSPDIAENQLLIHDQREVVLTAIRSLKEIYREVLVLRYYQDLKYSNDSIKNTLWAKMARHDAVPFQLTVDIDTESTVGANLEQVGQVGLDGLYKQRYYFKSPVGKDIFLFAGPYHYEKKTIPRQRDSVAVYSYLRHQGKVDQVLTSLADLYHFFENLIQPVRKLNHDNADSLYTLVELPSCFFCTDDGTPVKSLPMPNAIVLSENSFRKNFWHLDILDAIRTNESTIAVLHRWWQADITGEIGNSRHGDIRESLMLYLYVLYVDKTQQPGFYDGVKQNLLTGERTGNGKGDFARPDLIGGDVVRDVFLTLDDIRNTHQSESEFRVMMQQFYELTVQKGTVNPEDFSRIVETAIVRGNESAEQTANIRQRITSITQHVNDAAAQQLNAEPSLTIFVFNLEEWLP